MENLAAVLGLITLIASLVLISITIITALNHRKISIVSWRETLSLDAEKGLAKQGIFWVTILACALHFFVFGIFAWKDYSLALNAEGFITFSKISVLPLGLLAISIPITALIGKIHSTAQAARQIELTQEKNKYDLFYLHRREFVQFFQNMKTTIEDIEVSYNISPRIHGKLFSGDPAGGTPKLNEHELNTKIKAFKTAEASLLKTIKSPSLAEARRHYATYCRVVADLIVFFSIRDVNIQLRESSLRFSFENDGTSGTQRSIGSTTKHAIMAHECVRVYLMNTISFASYKDGMDLLQHDTPDFEEIKLRYATKRNIEKIIDSPTD